MRKVAIAMALLLASSGVAAADKECKSCPEQPVNEPPPSEALHCGNFKDGSPAKLVAALSNSGSAPRILMLSGGGSYGAWGAGFLNGWSQNRATPRPDFDLVTGSSTGAILGTWALLGGRLPDNAAQCAYTDTSDPDVYTPALFSWKWFEPWQWFSRAPGNWTAVRPWVSLKNLKPLRALFEKYTSIEMVKQVGELYRNPKHPRMFLAGTVDINLGAFCLWDMGKIAQQVLEAPTPEEAEEKYELYRDVVMASSSNPGIFNPTMLEGDMHVDGGVRFQIFLLPPVAEAIQTAVESWRRLHPETKKPVAPDAEAAADRCNQSDTGQRPRVYAVLNVPMTIPRICTGENIYNIAQRSLTVTQIQALIGNLYEVRWQLDNTLDLQGKWDLCVSHIPYQTKTWPFADEFPECKMRGLYSQAYAQALMKKPWTAELPGNVVSEHRCEGKTKKKCNEKCELPAPDCRAFD